MASDAVILERTKYPVAGHTLKNTDNTQWSWHGVITWKKDDYLAFMPSQGGKVYDEEGNMIGLTIGTKELTIPGPKTNGDTAFW